jgi:glycine/D-amino acid oxidase-like deaminating enzyme
LLACGHEGLGITTAPATAELVAAALLDRPALLDPTPYLPARFPELCHA